MPLCTPTRISAKPRCAHLAVRRAHPLAAALALAFSATGFAPAAWAQASAEAGKLQTVTVTAERREGNIKDVPSAVYSLSGEKLDIINSSGQDVRMLSGRVPSLNIESSFARAFQRFYIRGYGNTHFRSNASQSMSLVYDGEVRENPILKGFPAFDLAAIEVRAGPQGTLSGRNTPAGVVKFDSVKPGKKFEGLRQHLVRHLWHCQPRGCGQPADQWRLVSPHLGPGPAPRRLGLEHTPHRADPEPRGLRRPRDPVAGVLRAQHRFLGAVQPAQPRPEGLGPVVSRQHHQEGQQRPGRWF